MIPEQLQAHVPDTVDGWILQNISTIQVQENAANHNHLLAMRLPALVHLFEVEKLVDALGKARLDVGFYVRFNEGRQVDVELRVHFVVTHVFHGLVELLQTIDDRFGQLDGNYSLSQFLPGLFRVVFRQDRLGFEVFDYQFFDIARFAASTRAR